VIGENHEENVLATPFHSAESAGSGVQLSSLENEFLGLEPYSVSGSLALIYKTSILSPIPDPTFALDSSGPKSGGG